MTGGKRSSLSKTAMTISKDGVENLLRNAGAREPWAHPEKLPDLIDTIETVARMKNGVKDDLLPWKLRDRAQKAINELRNVLPQIIHLAVDGINNPSVLEQALAASESDESNERSLKQSVSNVAKIITMLEALVDVQPAKEVTNLLPLDGGRHSHWHFMAVLLLYSYRSVVGSGGAASSKTGPGVNFVQATLKLTGYGEPDLGTIAAAISRHSLNRVIETHKF